MEEFIIHLVKTNSTNIVQFKTIINSISLTIVLSFIHSLRTQITLLHITAHTGCMLYVRFLTLTL